MSADVYCMCTLECMWRFGCRGVWREVSGVYVSSLLLRCLAGCLWSVCGACGAEVFGRRSLECMWGIGCRGVGRVVWGECGGQRVREG